MGGKFFISASFAIIYIFTAELYPTELRNIGMGLSSLCARIGGILAPVIVASSPNATDPLIVFGVLAFAAGVFALVLPETKGLKMPETLQEAEAMEMTNILGLWRCQKKEENHEATGTDNQTFQDSSVL